jgi:hypothetical protein
MGIHRRAIVACVAWIGVACGGGESRWAGTITDSAGVTIVSNSAVGVWTETDRWTVEEELRIGVREGDPEYQFGEIGGIAVDSRGRLFILESQAQQINVYSAEGVYEQTVGARGSGPGEIGGAAALLMGLGDTLVVPDFQNLRINRYAPDGSSLGSSPIDMQQGFPLLFQATASGVLVRQVRQAAFGGQPAIEDPHDVIVRFAADGTVLDTVLTFPSGGTLGTSGGPPRYEVYSAEPAWDCSDELAVIYAVNDDYRLSVYSADGELERVITMPYEPAPVSERDREVFLGFVERQLSNAGLSAQGIATMKSRINFAEFFPAFANLVAGPEGTIWVQHTQAPSELSDEERENFNPLAQGGAMGNLGVFGTSDWYVFDPAGRYLGVVTLPARFTVRTIRGGRIYGVWRDELDVQYVLRLRIVGDLGAGAT